MELGEWQFRTVSTLVGLITIGQHGILIWAGRNDGGFLIKMVALCEVGKVARRTGLCSKSVIRL